MKNCLSKYPVLLRLLFSVLILSPAILFADPPPPLVVRVACVGDSITYGYSLTNRDEDSYPARLGHWLGTGYDVRNFGVSGATLLHKGNLPYIKQKAHADAVAFKPDIVIIMLGTNDSKHRNQGDSKKIPNNWQYKADYVPDYEALIAEFREANPAVKIYVCDPTPCFPGRWGISGATIHDEIIRLIHQVATDTKSTDINLYDPFVEHKDLFPDDIHPNDAGAQMMATVIYTALTGKTP
ncbi:MAG TPA: GDSL-type esterase/lipase family protein [Pseudomonadales bacterium]|nr:GDSL-type esterase/lipase family protein [Pseudomonadales bacterium]